MSAALPMRATNCAPRPRRAIGRPVRSPRRGRASSRRRSRRRDGARARASSTSITSATPSFMVTASGCAPPIPPRPAVSVTVPRSEPPKCCRASSPNVSYVPWMIPCVRDVDPRAGGHLAVHRQAGALELAELLPRRPVRHQVGVGDQHAWRIGRGAEDADRLAGGDQQRLVVLEAAKLGHDGVEGLPRPSRAPGAAVHDQVVRILGNLGIEVVHEHPQRRLLLPALAGELGAARRAHGAWAARGLDAVIDR